MMMIIIIIIIIIKRLHWYLIEIDVLIADAHRVLGKLRYSSLQ